MKYYHQQGLIIAEYRRCTSVAIWAGDPRGRCAENDEDICLARSPPGDLPHSEWSHTPMSAQRSWYVGASESASSKTTKSNPELRGTRAHNRAVRHSGKDWPCRRSSLSRHRCLHAEDEELL